MREIKFKYYCKDMAGKIFTFITTIQDLEQGKVNVNTMGRIQEIVARCQSTGLKIYDEKDELWQDDICEAEYECPVGYSAEPHILRGTIEWDEVGFWCFDYGHGSMALCEENLTITKIIGNTTENENLLKDKEQC